MLQSFIPSKNITTIPKAELIDEVLRLCAEEGLKPNEKKLRKKLMAAPIADVERLLDAFYRFGVRNILEY